jgi:hypothetical protein
LFTKVFIIFIALAFGTPKGFCSFKSRTYQEVLAQNYSTCKLKKENLFLSVEKQKKIQEQLGQKISSLLLRYKNPCNKSSIYVDSHTVRTLNETVIIEVKNKKVVHLEIASFMEPKDYLPPQKWLDLFKSKTKVDGLTGATLSENSIKKLVGKYLVIDNIIDDKI